MSASPSEPRVVSASRVITASRGRIFELIADPAEQPRWDGNENLREAAHGQRVRAVGDVFTMTLRRGGVRENRVVEFVEGRLIAWRPNVPGKQPPGHLWRWELDAAGERRTRVTHTYDWSELRDRSRYPRARATTPDRLAASLERLAMLAETTERRPGGPPYGWSVTATPTLTPYDETLERYDPVLGLETHVELGTATKLFCGCSTEFGAEPNTQVCPVCLGLPGSLPVTNDKAIEYTVMIGLALHCSIAPWCRFARKNYFYPDMPKNYQVSQYDEPLCVDGYLDVEVPGEDGAVDTYRVEIERVHLEEDTGKTLHVGGSTGRIHGATHSLVDYNRAGIPLVEIVTRPVAGTGHRAAAVARAYVTELRDLLRGLGVSDVRMEQGSLRCDVNLSLMPKGSDEFGTRTETKNVNSLRSVERAVRHEVERQGARLDAGERIVQETRHFHEDSGTTSPGRSKEEAQDYRYFPEPDLVPLAPDAAWVEKLRAQLPEPPNVVRRRFAEANGFTPLDLEQMSNAGVLGLVEDTIAAGAAPGKARGWWLGYLVGVANEQGTDPAELAITPAQVARISALEDEGTLTNKLARQVASAVVAGEGDPDAVIDRHGWKVAGEDELVVAVDAAITAHADTAEKVRGGNQGALGPLIGAVMSATGGSADARRVRQLLLERLSS